MDLHTVERHEAFLRAIYDDPENDLPRLVYADFWEESGETDRAELIRTTVRDRNPNTPPEEARSRFHRAHDLAEALRSRQPNDVFRYQYYQMIPGHPPFAETAEVPTCQLSSAAAVRRLAVSLYPNWNAATKLKVYVSRVGGESDHPCLPIGDGRIWDVILSAPPFRRVTSLDVAGTTPLHGASAGPGMHVSWIHDPTIHPTVTSVGVAALAGHRLAARLTELDLTNNDLDNDAARTLTNSPFLENLKVLKLLCGNRLRGRVWQQVLDRFGPDVAQ